MRQSIQEAPVLHRVDNKLGFWIPELDGLRAFACALVVIAHFNPWIASDQFVYQSVILQPIKSIQGGNTGVMLFFCLSSFLLTSVCLADIDRHGHINLAAFFLRRILRIWPLYFLYSVYRCCSFGRDYRSRKLPARQRHRWHGSGRNRLLLFMGCSLAIG
jgi:peptidoglycan/LPS O-acetylase OafA/YrhL